MHDEDAGAVCYFAEVAGIESLWTPLAWSRLRVRQAQMKQARRGQLFKHIEATAIHIHMGT